MQKEGLDNVQALPINEAIVKLFEDEITLDDMTQLVALGRLSKGTPFEMQCENPRPPKSTRTRQRGLL